MENEICFLISIIIDRRVELRSGLFYSRGVKVGTCSIGGISFFMRRHNQTALLAVTDMVVAVMDSILVQPKARRKARRNEELMKQ